jgi:hypothetical protein
MEKKAGGVPAFFVCGIGPLDKKRRPEKAAEAG